jgi:hypothetical protein
MGDLQVDFLHDWRELLDELLQLWSQFCLAQMRDKVIRAAARQAHAMRTSKSPNGRDVLATRLDKCTSHAEFQPQLLSRWR